MLSAEEEHTLAVRASAGDPEAKGRLVEANLRLVIRLARSYTGHGLDLLDLIQEGNLGLLHAVERFDAESGHRLSTYAYRWIQQAISRAVEKKGGHIRLPSYIH
jgi:RNA polymerase sigma factor (sigma-70 family)